MTDAISFFVPGTPQGKGRPRFMAGRVVTPQATRTYEKDIGWYAKRAMVGARVMSAPVSLTVSATFTHPGSWSAKKKQETHWKTSKPDLDNIVKAVKDALNKIVWIDDSQVVTLTATKHYARGLEAEGLLISVEPLGL